MTEPTKVRPFTPMRVAKRKDIPDGAVRLLRPNAIVVDPEIQARTRLNGEAVADYAAVMVAATKEGRDPEFPPIVVFVESESLDFLLADGFHRLAAAKAAGLKKILAKIHHGTRREAMLFAVGANSEHGVRRTNADKRRAVARLLQDDEWRAWSNREIARACKVAHPFVGELRKELRVTGNGVQSPRKVRYRTRHGTEAMMDTARIGKSRGEAKAKEQPTGLIEARCACPRSIFARKAVLKAGSIRCSVCKQHFSRAEDPESSAS